MAEQTKAPEAFTAASVPAADPEPDQPTKASGDKSSSSQTGGVSASRLGWVALLPLLALAATAMWQVSPVLAVGVLGGVVVLACVVGAAWLVVRLLTRRRTSRTSAGTAPAAQGGVAGGRAPRGAPAGGGRRPGGSRSNSGRAPTRGSDGGGAGGGWWSRRGDRADRRGSQSRSKSPGGGGETRPGRGRQPGAEQSGKQPKPGAQPSAGAQPGWWRRRRNKSDTTGPKGAKAPAAGIKGGISTPGSPGGGGSNQPRSRARHPGGGSDHSERDRSRHSDRNPTKKSRWRRRDRTPDGPRGRRRAEGRGENPRPNRWWRGESREWQQWPDRKAAQPDQGKQASAVATTAAGSTGKTKQPRRRKQRKAPGSQQAAVVPGDPTPGPDDELVVADARMAANRQGRADAVFQRTDGPRPDETAPTAGGMARHPTRATSFPPVRSGGDQQESTKIEGAPPGAPERTVMSAPTPTSFGFEGLPELDASTTPRLIATLTTRADVSRQRAAGHEGRAHELRAEAARCAEDGDDYADFLAQADLHETHAQALVARASAYEDSAAAELARTGGGS